MSKAIITSGQARSIAAYFLLDTPWGDNIEGNIQPFIELSPNERGRVFADFLQEVCERFMLIWIKKSFNPVEFIGEGWSIWKGSIEGDGLSGDEEQDKRALALTKIELRKLSFESCLKEDENSIIGEQKLLRLKEKEGFMSLGAHAFLALWEDYQTREGDSFLEKIYQKYNITYMDFFGTILRYPDGDRGVLSLFRDGGGMWDWDCGWLDGDWDAGLLSAGCASN